MYSTGSAGPAAAPGAEQQSYWQCRQKHCKRASLLSSVLTCEWSCCFRRILTICNHSGLFFVVVVKLLLTFFFWGVSVLRVEFLLKMLWAKLPEPALCCSDFCHRLVQASASPLPRISIPELGKGMRVPRPPLCHSKRHRSRVRWELLLHRSILPVSSQFS